MDTISKYSQLIGSPLQLGIEEAIKQTEIFSVIDGMIQDVETWNSVCNKIELQNQLKETNYKVEKLQTKQTELLLEIKKLKNEKEVLCTQGADLSIRFKEELKKILLELSKKKELEKELNNTKELLLEKSELEDHLMQANREIKELKRLQEEIQKESFSKSIVEEENKPSSSLKKKSKMKSIETESDALSENIEFNPNLIIEKESFFCSVKVHLIDNISGYIEAEDVYALASSSKSTYKKIGDIFGFEMKTNKSSTSSSSSNIASLTTTLDGKTNILPKLSLSSSRVDKLVKSLNTEDLMLFSSLTIQLRSAQTALAKIQTEKEDIAERMKISQQMTEFHERNIKKLQEIIVKGREEVINVKKQEEYNREIIGYLDYRVSQLEEMVMNVENEKKEILEKWKGDQMKSRESMMLLEEYIAMEKSKSNTKDMDDKKRRLMLAREVKSLREQKKEMQKILDAYKKRDEVMRNALNITLV